MIAEAQKYGPVTMLVNAAGVSPSQAPVEAILKVDLYGTAVLLEEVGKIIAPGDLKFYGIESLVRRFLVLETTDGNTEPVFTLTATPREHVARYGNQ